MRDLDSYCAEGLPELDPVISFEITDYGWRGLTEQGEIYEVKGSNGHRIEVPSEIIVARGGKPFGRRAIRNDVAVDIDAYLSHFNRAVDCYKQNQLERALAESDLTLETFPTLRGKFNRAMMLLAAGRWSEGLADYLECEQHAPFMRPQVREALDRGMQPWRGESLRGKKLLVMHAHGFGDTIQMLRYVPALRTAGTRVVVALPPEIAAFGQYAVFRGRGLLLPDPASVASPACDAASDRWSALSRGRCKDRPNLADQDSIRDAQGRHRMVGRQAERGRLSARDSALATGRGAGR